MTSLAKWMLKFAMRLGALKAPGVYELILVVHEDGRRDLVVKNPGQPHGLEHLN